LEIFDFSHVGLIFNRDSVSGTGIDDFFIFSGDGGVFYFSFEGFGVIFKSVGVQLDTSLTANAF